jgi:hypothetical protein
MRREEWAPRLRIVMPVVLALLVCALPFAYLVGALALFARSSTL